MDTLQYLKIGFSVAATCLTSFLGDFDKLLQYLVTLIIVDYITGVLVAIVKKSLSSEVGLKGIVKKVMQLMLVGVATILDNVSGTNDPYVRSTVIYFLIANEGISILENAAAVGIPVPTFLSGILEKLKGEITNKKEGK